MDWTSVVLAGLKGAALGGATILAVYLLRRLSWEGPVPKVVQRLRWLIGFLVGVAVFVGLDFLGVGPGVQRTVSAAVVFGVAFTLKERSASGPALRDELVSADRSPEELVPEAATRRGHGSRRKYYWVATFVAAVIGGVAAKEAVRWWRTPATVSSEVLSETWGLRRLGSSALSIALPAPLEEQQRAAIPTEVAAVTQSWRQYRYKGAGVEVHATHAVYSDDAIADLEGAIAGAMSNMSQVRGVSGFRHHREPYRVGSGDDALVRFDFKGGQQPYVGQALFVVRRNELWSVLLIYSATDATASRFADRVLNSAKLEE